MTKTEKKVAIITDDHSIIENFMIALSGLFIVDVYSNELSMLYAMQQGSIYSVIVIDAELFSVNSIDLKNKLGILGFNNIPFVLMVSGLNMEKRKLAIQNGIADIFAKPVELKTIKVRIPFLAENFAAVEKKDQKKREYQLPLIKRCFDVFFSGLALLCLSPFFLIIWMLIKLESRGPAIYYSLRVGSGYKVFKFFKFRSMFIGADSKLKDLAHLNQYSTTNAEPSSEAAKVKVLCDLCEQAGTPCQHLLFADDKVLCEMLYLQQKETNKEAAFIKIKNDPRITKVGKFIRNTSIDELPQLWNVFIGDMSIVGNRPLPLYEAEKITTDKYALRFMAPAGITGLWQVEKRGRGEMSEEERLNLDNNYAKTHSFKNDIKLILKTIPTLFQSENV